MKKVSFGEDTIIEVENISKYLSWKSSFVETLLRHLEALSMIREIYPENRVTPLLLKIVDMICNHEDVFHVDIYVHKNLEEEFFIDLASNMERVFNSSKSANVIVGEKTLFCFFDAYANPTFDDMFSVKERWV